MWVKMVVGFDEDGLLIPKWRDAFMLGGAYVAELSLQEEEVPKLRRRTLVARLRFDGKQVCPPLADVAIRYVKEQVFTLSGISEAEPWNRWHAQAWRMELTTRPLDLPAPCKAYEPITAPPQNDEEAKCPDTTK